MAALFCAAHIKSLISTNQVEGSSWVTILAHLCEVDTMSRVHLRGGGGRGGIRPPLPNFRLPLEIHVAYTKVRSFAPP